MQGIFYIECFTRNGSNIEGYFETFEAAHDTLISSFHLSNYDEVETTGRIMFQPFGLNKKPYLVCDRHGEFDVIEDYYNKKQQKVQSIRYQHKSIVAAQRMVRTPAVTMRKY